MLHYKLISIVVPIYNEALVLDELYQRLTKVTSESFSNSAIEYIFVDDGSADDSLNVLNRLGANDKRITILELRANYGQTAALQAGLRYARGEVVISMDGDLQHFPEDIYGSHTYQHLKSDTEIKDLIHKLQSNPDKVLNFEKYFLRPAPIGCALRILR